MFSFCSDRRESEVLITGVGLCTPLGCSAAETWSALLQERSAARSLLASEMPRTEQLKRIEGLVIAGCPVDHDEVRSRLQLLTEFPGSGTLAPETFAEPTQAMLAVALHDALNQADLTSFDFASSGTGICIGSSKGSLRWAELWHQQQLQAPTAAPLAAPAIYPLQTDNTARMVARLLRTCGPATAPVAACASGLIAIIQAAQLIASGRCEICIAGAADASLRPEILASFHRLGVTSRSTPASRACKPLDAGRDGFLIGEAAGLLILESRRHAEQRSAAALCQLAAGGWCSDPTGMTQVNESGVHVARLLQNGSEICRQTPSIIGLHGTGTQSNDLTEAMGVLQAVGKTAVCYATKGATGHLLGASGAVETAILALAAQQSIIPGTMNHQQTDPRFSDLCVNRSPAAAPANALWARLSLGFGGHVAAAFLRPI